MRGVQGSIPGGVKHLFSDLIKGRRKVHIGDPHMIGYPVIQTDKFRACCISWIFGESLPGQSASQPLIIQPGSLTELLIPQPIIPEPLIFGTSLALSL
jgi:hypothetical protein